MIPQPKHRDVQVWTSISLLDVLKQITPSEVVSHYGAERLLQEIGFEKVKEYMDRVNGETKNDVTQTPPTA